MKPVRVKIITYAPTAFFHCQHCEIAFHHLGIGPRVRRDEADESLPIDLQFEYLDLSQWVHELVDRHGPAVAVQVVDAASVAGIWTSLRHGVRSYPAVIVAGPPGQPGQQPASRGKAGQEHKAKRVGNDYRALDPVIDRLVAATADQANKGGATT